MTQPFFNLLKKIILLSGIIIFSQLFLLLFDENADKGLEFRMDLNSSLKFFKLKTGVLRSK
jgi:hypothetical protein